MSRTAVRGRLYPRPNGWGDLSARWRSAGTTLYNGPEVLRFADSRFSIIFYVKQPVPLELRERFRIGPLGCALYGLELWDKQIGKGKVLNINWQTAGAVPRIVTFKRGDKAVKNKLKVE